MTDPLSVSASVAGLVSLADVVFSKVFRYAKAVKDAESDIALLAEKTQALSGVLHSLFRLSLELDDQDARREIRHRHFESCGRILQRIKQALEGREPSAKNGLANSIKIKLSWPFSSSETKKLVDQISGLHTEISQSMNADSMHRLLQSLSTQTEIRNELGKINDEIEKLNSETKRRWEFETRISMDDHRRKVLDFFGSVDPSSNHDTSLKLRHPLTGLWLIEHGAFKQWLDIPGSKLWLSGIPGAGKTVLASLVVEEALKQSSSRRAVAYFYCDYKDQNRQDPVKILGAIAAQISRQDESQESFEKLEKYYVECHPKGRGPRRPEAQRLLDLIREMCRSSFDEASIVVDALDECGENQVPVVNILQKLNGDKFSRISTLFLSRDEHHLRSRLEKTYAHIPIAAHTDDLQLYVAAEVELRIEEGRLHEPNPALKAEIVECLVNKADGMFRWVTCQLDDLCRSRTDSALRKALRSLPTTLSETYERILERVNQCGTDEQELVEYTLRWLLFAPRMDIAALCEALAIKDGSNQLNHEDVPGLGDILILCSSLVRKSVKGDYLEISHFTVEEFLLSIDPIRRKNLVRYHMDRKAAVVKLSIQRLTYLTWTDFSLKLANSLEEMDERWRRYPFRKFAVDAFSVCREGWDDQRVLDKAKVLLSPTKTHNFLSWAQEKVIRSSLRHGDRFLHGPSSFKRLTSAIASGSMGPLHFAAMFRIPEIVQWLLDMGCEANQMSDFGTPVHCVLTGIDGYGQKCQPWEARSETALKPILQMLFASGATCSHNLYAHELPWRTNHRSISVMGIVLDMNCTDEYERKLISELVSLVGDFGGRLEEHELSILEWRMQDPSAMELVVRAISDDWIPARLTDWYTKLKIQLELQLKVQEIGDEGPEPGEPEELQESIWEAAAHDQESVLQDLLKRPGIDIDAADDSGQSALHRATSQGSVRAMRILLGSGASVHKVDQMRQTPLHKCSSNRNTQGLTLILEAGANPGAIDESGCNVWHLAAKENNPEILEALTLLDSDWKEALRATCFRGFTPLVHAANSDSLESLSFLIERTEGWKADPTFADAFIALPCHKSTRRFQEYLGQFWDSILQTNDFDVRAMEYAIKQNNVDLVRSLLSRGTCTHDATKKDSRPTPLELACSKNCCDAIFELIVENTRIDEPFQERASYGQGLVHRLCSEEKLLRVDRLRQVRLRGMDINLLDCFGKTALMNAAENNKPELLAALLENNADPGITAGDGWNFLHFAASSGSKSCFEVLDRFEIPPYVWTAWTERSRFRHRDELSSEFSDPSPKSTSRFSRKSYSQSIMHLAVVHPQLLQYLLVKGIFEVDCRAENEYTPLHEAVDMDQIDSARSLIRHGANFNATTKAGRTPLHFASGRDGSLFAYLMGCGADPRVSDRNGNLPIHVAASRGRNYIVSVLLEAGPIDVKNHDGMTPELCALAAGHNYTANLINKTSQNHATITTSQSQKIEVLSHALMTAVGRGDSHEVDRFLDAGANIDQIPLHPGKCGCTPLVSAFENGHPDMARLLICRGASLNFQTCGNAKAPFLKVTHLAALAPQFNGVLSLLLCQNSVSLQLDNDTPIHPLHVAVATCNEPGQKILLDHIQKSTPNAEHSHTRSIESGVPLSQTSDKCLSCSIINVQARASYRCNDPSFTIDRGYTPLLIAASESCYFCVELLLKYGADSNFPEYFVPPLHHAIWSGSQDITRLLLEHGANPNSRTSNMETAAIIALCRGSLEHLELLEEFGADCTLSNWKDRRKLSAMLTNTGKLMIPELTVFLLERGYPLQNISRLFVVSAKDAPDNQPRKSRSLTQEYSPGSSGSSLNQDAIFYQLDDLMLSGSLFEIKRALKYESKDPGTKRKFEIQGPQQKISRLCQASLGKCIDDIDLLLKYGTDIDEEGCPDGSALMAACSAGRIDSVQFLVRRGAKLTYPNGLRFRSALTAAEGHPGIQHWLLVERHTQQFKIKDARAGELEADSRSMKPWAGLEEVRIPWKGRFQRYSEESSFEHFLRLREIRGKLQGQVISWTTDPPDIFLAW